MDSDPTGALKARFYFPTSSEGFIPASLTDNGALLSLQLRNWLDSMLGSIQDEMIKFNRIMAMQLVREMFSKSSRREPYMVYDSYDNFFIDPYWFEKIQKATDREAGEDAYMGENEEESDDNQGQEEIESTEGEELEEVESTESSGGEADEQEQDEQRKEPRARKIVRWDGERK